MNDAAELLRSYAETRDETAFTEFVRRHLGLVYFAALRRSGGNSTLAEEVAQYVFAETARRATTLAGHGSLTGWLYTTTRNATVMAVRKERSRQIREQEASHMRELESNEPALDRDALRPLIDEALDALPEREREAVLLRFFEGQPFARVGATLRISEDAARMRVERALEKLRGRLARRGLTSTDATLAAALTAQGAMALPTGLATSVTGAALGGAAVVASVGPLAVVIGFMSSAKVTLVVSAVGALATAAAFYQTKQARTAADESVEARHDYARLTSRLAGLEASVKSAEKDLAERAAARLQQPNAPAKTATSAEISPEAAATLDRNRKFEETLAALRRSDPEYLELGLAAGRAANLLSYRPLFRKLGFTPQQCEDAGDLLMEVARQRRERGEDLTTDDGEAAKAAYFPAFRAKFGNEITEQFGEYVKTRAERNFVSNLSARMYFIEEPFTQPQAKQLISIIARARGPRARLPDALVPLATFESALDWDKILVDASAVLSPTQLQGLRGRAAQGRAAALLASAAQESVPPKK